jgi:hypothetical protein
MRILAAAAAAALLAAGCGGGGGKHTSFTNADYQTLVDHPAKYDGAHVDISGEVAGIAHDEQGTLWLLLYADPAHAAQTTLVEVQGNPSVQEQRLVQVVGTVKNGLTVPFDLAGYQPAPIVLADKVTPKTGR